MMSKEWKKSVDKTLGVVLLTKKKLEHNCSHTADDKKLKKGMTVYFMDDPSLPWKVSEIEIKITFKVPTITLIRDGSDPIKKHPTKLFVSQEKAISEGIKDIQNAEKVILRDMRESMARLDAPNKIKKMEKLKKNLREVKK
jgi:hypothetical protein